MSEMRLSQQLWQDNEDLAQACLEHPFLQGLADGSLSDERYGLFAQQDHFYLDAYARSYAFGVVRAPDWATRRKFGQLLAGILTEGTLHEQTAPELGVLAGGRAAAAGGAGVHRLPAGDGGDGDDRRAHRGDGAVLAAVWLAGAADHRCAAR